MKKQAFTRNRLDEELKYGNAFQFHTKFLFITESGDTQFKCDDVSSEESRLWL